MRDKPQCGHTRLHEGCSHCLSLQLFWYAKLADLGFKEQENIKLKLRPLKQWTGDDATLIDQHYSQEPDAPLTSSFPSQALSIEEKLLSHPEFTSVCRRVCSHGNHKLNPTQVKRVWIAYIDGGSNRSIAKLLHINDTLVHRTIKTLTQWANFMEMDDVDDIAPVSKVILRKYNPKTDEAFIYASWRNAMWFDNDKRQEGESDRFFRKQTRIIRTILANPKTEIRVACLSDSHDLIIGYSVINNRCICFVYVKSDYRNKRIGSLLTPRHVDTVLLPLTKIGRAIAVKKGFIKENGNGKASEEERDGEASPITNDNTH